MYWGIVYHVHIPFYSDSRDRYIVDGYKHMVATSTSPETLSFPLSRITHFCKVTDVSCHLGNGTRHEHWDYVDMARTLSHVTVDTWYFYGNQCLWLLSRSGIPFGTIDLQLVCMLSACLAISFSLIQLQVWVSQSSTVIHLKGNSATLT